MKALKYKGKTITLDDEGFLSNPDEWSEDVAKTLALQEGLESLTDEQMEIIKFMRSYYEKFNAFPILNQVCKNIHQPRECVNEQFINPEKAWKVAGLPKLSGVHFVTLDGQHYRMEECC
ncbi:MAG: TusE/DsrC/DsvC family sulfur relay protein [Desulfobulbaceae bacterium]|nr:TusE/DsrC/DsvC family sulfur relay protein [Desulfobulbaceae bacterium]